MRRYEIERAVCLDGLFIAFHNSAVTPRAPRVLLLHQIRIIFEDSSLAAAILINHRR